MPFQDHVTALLFALGLLLSQAQGAAPAPPSTALQAITQRLQLSPPNKGALLVMDGAPLGRGEAAIEGARIELPDGSERPLHQAEIAGVCGGAGVGRVHQVHLQDGSVLVGRVGWDKAVFRSPSFPGLPLNPETLDLLVFANHTAAPDPGPARCVALADGSQLRITRMQTGVLRVTGLWGEAAIPLQEVDSLEPAADPGAPCRVRLNDGSHLLAWHAEIDGLDGPDPVDGQLRALATSFSRLQAVLREPSTPASPTTATPRVQLLDGSILLSTVASATFSPRHGAGPVRSDSLIRLVRNAGVHPASFAATSEAHPRGIACRPMNDFLSCRIPGSPLRIPWHQVQEIIFKTVSDPDAPEEPAIPPAQPPAP